MAFNQFMHPRNLYRKKPDYAELARLYPEFGEHVRIETNGRAIIDYSDPCALRHLTCTLLKHHFGLEVNIPDNRLVPTLPMRLNYLLWIEDLLRSCNLAQSDTSIIGLDIGTGSCAIFPLLGATLNRNWSFIASDIDALNLHYAKTNVNQNGLSDRIKVVEAIPDSMFIKLLNLLKVNKVNFIMTNPPFFADTLNDSYDGESSMTSKRSTLHRNKVCSSSLTEAVVEGGEVTFVQNIIKESLEVRNCVDIYTVMLGRRQSFLVIKHQLQEYLKQGLISSLDNTELCQGNTKRWALAWSFANINLARAPRVKCIKPKPLLYIVPMNIVCCKYSIQDMALYIRNLLLNDLHISTFSMIETKKYVEFDIQTNVNTWSNQRRKRRQNKLMQDSTSELADEIMQTDVIHTPKRVFEEDDEEEREEEEISSKKYKDNSDLCKCDLTCLLHCSLKVKRDKQQVLLKMITKEKSQNKESTCQLMQYFKNKLV